MKIHGTAKGGALGKKDFGVAFGGGGDDGCDAQVTNIYNTSNYSWSFVQPSYVTVTNGDDDAGGLGDMSQNGQQFSGYGRGVTEITSRSTKTFEFKFTYNRQSGDAGNNNVILLSSYEWADDTPSGSEKFIKFQVSNGNIAFFRAQTASASVTTTQDAEFFQAVGTRYYTISGDGTNWKAQSWSDSDRTTDEKDTGNQSFPADWVSTNALDLFIFGGFSGYHANQFQVSETSVCWDNGENP